MLFRSGLYDAGASIMRSQNNSRNPMIISVISNFMNIGGNAILIFVLGMGVEGAAISTLVSRIFCAIVVELLMAAYFPALHAALGIYIPLIVVNCIILGRAEAFASRNTVGQSVLDALGMGLGFTWALLALGLIREILGAGSAFGFSFVGEDAYPVLLFIMPPGAFLALAGLIVVFNWLRRK